MRLAFRECNRALLARIYNLSFTFPSVPTFPHVEIYPTFSIEHVERIRDGKLTDRGDAPDFGAKKDSHDVLGFELYAFPGPQPRSGDLSQLSRKPCDSCDSPRGSLYDGKTLAQQRFAIVAIVFPCIRVKKQGDRGETENPFLLCNDGKLSQTIEPTVFFIFYYRKDYRRTIATIASKKPDEVAISDVILLVALSIPVPWPSTQMGRERAESHSTAPWTVSSEVHLPLIDGQGPSTTLPPVKGPYHVSCPLRARRTPRGWPFEGVKLWVNGLTG